jgi:hypothetical protein
MDEEFTRELNVCLEWLKDKPRIKSINKKVSTIDIKQTIERTMKTYVSKDAVTEAVRLLEIPNKTDPYYGIVYLALSTKVLGMRERLLEMKRNACIIWV